MGNTLEYMMPASSLRIEKIPTRAYKEIGTGFCVIFKLIGMVFCIMICVITRGLG